MWLQEKGLFGEGSILYNPSPGKFCSTYFVFNFNARKYSPSYWGGISKCIVNLLLDPAAQGSIPDIYNNFSEERLIISAVV